MNSRILIQRGVLYGVIGGGGTIVLITLVATFLNLSLGLIATVLFLGAIIVLGLLLGASGIGPGPATEGESFDDTVGSEGHMVNPTEASGGSMNPASLMVVRPTRLEYVLYFLGLAIAAAILLTLLLS